MNSKRGNFPGAQYCSPISSLPNLPLLMVELLSVWAVVNAAVTVLPLILVYLAAKWHTAMEVKAKSRRGHSCVKCSRTKTKM